MTENLPPSAAEVDALAEEMLTLKGKVGSILEKAQQDSKPHLDRMGELKEVAERWIRAFGSAHAEKSKLLHGILYEIMGTFGMSTSIDAAAVEAFRKGLVKSKQAKLLKKLFTKTVRFDLNPDGAEIVKGVTLKPRLVALWAKCFVNQSKTPVITPRLKKKENGVAA